jgi:carboxyl-terminal processing protease
MTLTQKQRKQILAAIRKRILKSHFNVAGVNYDEWLKTLDARTEQLLSGDTETFEAGVQEILKGLGSSHTGFFHERPSRLFPQHTINATLGRFIQGEQPRWFFLDVFEEGPADRAGIKPGDVLHEVDGVGYAPPDMPPLRTGVSHELSVSAPNGTEWRRVLIDVPQRKGNKDLPPILPPKSISSSMVERGIGLLRITWFPGAMGLGFAKSLDAAISDLKRQGCDRLIVDLRGNIGGGLGFARLASYFCQGKVPIGYSLTPKRARNGYTTEHFERVVYPSSRLGFATTLGRFAFRDKSIFLLTQGLGQQPFHGGIVLLVNEWTNSAAEMVAAFAAENKLAKIVGIKTAGNVLGAVNVKVGSGYWLRLPVFGWYTNTGNCVEGRGVMPEATVEVDPDELTRGIDNQMVTALDICRGYSKEPPSGDTNKHSAAVCSRTTD